MDWPEYKLARDLAGRVFPVSKDVILAAARRHGIGRKLGRAIVFSVEDVSQLYELLPCPSASSNGYTPRTCSSAAPSAESAYEKALAFLSQSESRPKRRAPGGRLSCSNRRYTAVRRRSRSPKPAPDI
jgi:hypothetical protein